MSLELDSMHDEIDRLREENARLREALQWLAFAVSPTISNGHVPDWDPRAFEPHFKDAMAFARETLKVPS